jgi:hypothetical protein
MATGWTVRGSNSGGGEIFRTYPDQPWGPPSLLYSGYRVFPGGKERPGRDADPSPTSSAAGHEKVELYLYSPYGPYGLYRASVPVQGCTLPFTFFMKQRNVPTFSRNVCYKIFSSAIYISSPRPNVHFNPNQNISLLLQCAMSCCYTDIPVFL